MSSLRRQVLSNFKTLHRTRLKVFSGDQKALEAVRQKINEEFNKNKHVQAEESIQALLKFGHDVDRELKTQVIQARQVEPGVFEARITEDTLRVDNVPYNDSAVPDDGVKGTGCCQNKDTRK